MPHVKPLEAQLAKKEQEADAKHFLMLVISFLHRKQALSWTSVNTESVSVLLRHKQIKSPSNSICSQIILLPCISALSPLFLKPKAHLKHIICSAISKQSAHYQANYPTLIACLINLILSIITI